MKSYRPPSTTWEMWLPLNLHGWWSWHLIFTSKERYGIGIKPKRYHCCVNSFVSEFCSDFFVIVFIYLIVGKKVGFFFFHFRHFTVKKENSKLMHGSFLPYYPTNRCVWEITEQHSPPKDEIFSYSALKYGYLVFLLWASLWLTVS